MADKFNEDQKELLKSAFEACDEDNSGFISKEELTQACKSSGYDISPGQLTFIFTTIDKDRNGQIDFEEFLEFIYVCQFKQTDIEQARLIFQGFDADGEGGIDKNELFESLTTLGVNVTFEQVSALFGVLDKDNSGSLDFKEFLQLFRMIQNEQKGN